MIGLDEPDFGMGQDQAEVGDLPPQIHNRLAAVDLGVTRRMMQRHECLARRLPLRTHIVHHDGKATVAAQKFFENS